MVIEVIDDHGSGHDFEVESTLKLFIVFLELSALNRKTPNSSEENDRN